MRAGRDTRGLGCVAAAVVVTARGVAGGLLSFSRLGLAAGGAGSVWVLPRFFSRSVRTPDARGRSGRSSGGWTGVVRRNGATKTRGVYYFCLLRGGDLDFSQCRRSARRFELLARRRGGGESQAVRIESHRVVWHARPHVTTLRGLTPKTLCSLAHRGWEERSLGRV